MEESLRAAGRFGIKALAQSKPSANFNYFLHAKKDANHAFFRKGQIAGTSELKFKPLVSQSQN